MVDLGSPILCCDGAGMPASLGSIQRSLGGSSLPYGFLDLCLQNHGHVPPWASPPTLRPPPAQFRLPALPEPPLHQRQRSAHIPRPALQLTLAWER